MKNVQKLILSASAGTIDPVVGLPPPDGLKFGDGHAKVKIKKLSTKADADGNYPVAKPGITKAV